MVASRQHDRIGSLTSRAAYSKEENDLVPGVAASSSTMKIWLEIELRPVTHRVNAIPPSTDMVGDEKTIADVRPLDVGKCMRAPIVMGIDLLGKHPAKAAGKRRPLIRRQR